MDAIPHVVVLGELARELDSDALQTKALLLGATYGVVGSPLLLPSLILDVSLVLDTTAHGGVDQLNLDGLETFGLSLCAALVAVCHVALPAYVLHLGAVGDAAALADNLKIFGPGAGIGARARDDYLGLCGRLDVVGVGERVVSALHERLVAVLDDRLGLDGGAGVALYQGATAIDLHRRAVDVDGVGLRIEFGRFGLALRGEGLIHREILVCDRRRLRLCGRSFCIWLLLRALGLCDGVRCGRRQSGFVHRHLRCDSQCGARRHREREKCGKRESLRSSRLHANHLPFWLHVHACDS